jgi:hypothetical protein
MLLIEINGPMRDLRLGKIESEENSLKAIFHHKTS